MLQIRNEIEMLQNPMLRKAYEEVNFTADTVNSGNGMKTLGTPNVFIVTRKSTIKQQIEFMEVAKMHITNDETINFLPTLKVETNRFMHSLCKYYLSFFWIYTRLWQDCFGVSAPNDHIYIPIARHTIKLLEPLSSNGVLKAIGSNEHHNNPNGGLMTNGQAIIASEEHDNVLLLFNGDYTIENVSFDCRNVRLGIRCRRGTVTLKNCRLIDSSKSSINNGISIAGRLRIYRIPTIRTV